MKRMILLGALALTTAAAAQAPVVVRAPGVYVEVGPAVVVRAFGVEVIVPRRAARPVLPAAPPMVPADPAGVPPVPKEEDLLLPAPTPTPLPAPKATPVPAPEGVVRAVTPGEFVARAKPFKPGAYEVVFVHPHTNRPVKVTFDLPVPPRRVNVTRTRIDFRWGLFHGMTLNFDPDGTVRVTG
ncbi:MAG: hypothetical protein ACRC33_27695 [Gemmataceae bacterium]